MCYVKPGPRCSKHARKALQVAKQNNDTAAERLEDAKQQSRQSNDVTALKKAQEEKEKAHAKFQEAYKDWAVTPEGITAVRAKGDDKMADRLASVRKGLINASKGTTPKAKPAPVKKASATAIKRPALTKERAEENVQVITDGIHVLGEMKRARADYEAREAEYKNMPDIQANEDPVKYAEKVDAAREAYDSSRSTLYAVIERMENYISSND